MENKNHQKEKAPVRKGFMAILILAIAIFGLYNLILYFLRYLEII